MRCAHYAVVGLSLLSTMAVPLSGAEAKSQLTTLYNFKGGSDGAYPFGHLVLHSGNLYGTTTGGGANSMGTVFVVPPGGQETVLYSFAGGDDGASPSAGLVLGSDGNFYGVTESGGANSYGTIFRISPAGKEKVIYTFTGKSDGGEPKAALITDDAGNLYGTAPVTSTATGGVVFRLTAKGTFSVLHTFGVANDGITPLAGLYMDANGNLYGDTFDGGLNGVGIVYQLTPKKKENILFNFNHAKSGAQPEGELIRGGTGEFYSTTYYGGAGSDGVVFQLSSKGKEKVLHFFKGGHDGANSDSNLVMNSAGTLYGTTVQGGASGYGVVFKQPAGGKESVLHAFNGADGEDPEHLIIDGAGNLYGVTFQGGSGGVGTVFELKP